MNVRIDESGVRFRIVPDDLTALLAGQRLEQEVAIGTQSIFYEIVPADAGEMALTAQNMRFTLVIPRRALEELRDLGRSKKGISVRQGDADVALQVDLKVSPVRG